MGWGTVCFHLHTEVLQAHKHIWPVSLNLSDILISKKHRGSLPFQALWALLWSAVFIHRPDTTQWKTITFFKKNHRLGSFSKWSQHYSFAMKLFFLSISLHIQELGMQTFARVSEVVYVCLSVCRACKWCVKHALAAATKHLAYPHCLTNKAWQVCFMHIQKRKTL